MPMKSGGGGTIHTTARVVAPLRTVDGGSGGSVGTGKTLAAQASAGSGSNQHGAAASKPVFHSDVAAGQDSVQKH